MKIWEMLNEQNIGKKCRVINKAEKHSYWTNDINEIGKNGNDKIGIFDTNDFVIDYQSTDIIYLDFELKTNNL